MDVVPVPLPHSEAAQADVCPACLGVFLEYFDGEPIGIARGLLALRPELELPPPGALDLEEEAPSKSGVPDPGPVHCPGCGCSDIAELSYQGGPTVSRCHDCLSLSATREQLVRLAHHRLPREPRWPWWARFVRRLRSL
jgi:hypothetical protein